MDNQETFMADYNRAMFLPWAKSSVDPPSWLPLYVHMADTCGVSLRLWNTWVGENTRRDVVAGISVNGKNCDVDFAGKFLSFLGAVHDIGKASPVFQLKIESEDVCGILAPLEDACLNMNRNLRDREKMPHSLVSYLIMERNGFDRSVSVIAGGHHGVPPTRDDIFDSKAYADHTGFGNDAWVGLQNGLLEYAAALSGIAIDVLRGIRVSVETQALLSGLLIISDWIASNEQCFPLIGPGEVISTVDVRVEDGWGKFNMPERNHLHPIGSYDFLSRFGVSPRPFQRDVCELAELSDGPGMMIIEAPTGEGKTKAALAAAEIMMHRFDLSGVFFALPTQATANGIFPIVEEWAERSFPDGVRTLSLAHGRSKFNERFTSIERIGWDTVVQDGGGRVFVHKWFTGKKNLLSDFVIGTVDQVLMMGLKSRHLALKHLAMSDKVVVIDECHAYDEYMTSYLSMALRWLGAYHVPVILMSATLPTGRKQELISAYLGNGADYGSDIPFDSYPLISFVSEGGCDYRMPELSGRSSEAAIRKITDANVIPLLQEISSDGGRVGLIVNTVRRAQELYDSVKEAFPEADVRLIHSGFTVSERESKEQGLLSILGPGGRRDNRKLFIIGTQILEQSLDLDFDALFTDICPVDLLIQRMGRLHRREDSGRPDGMIEPVCYLIDSGGEALEDGSKAVYGEYQLLNSRILIGQSIHSPEDVAPLVHSAYDGLVDVPESIAARYSEAERKYAIKKSNDVRKAKAFQILEPTKAKNLVGWIENRGDDSEIKASAAVRDTDGAVEVILIRRINGMFRTIPCATDYPDKVISADSVPEDGLAFSMAGCMVRLPRKAYTRGIDGTVEWIFGMNRKEIPPAWSDSEWLSGALFLILDEDMCATLMGVEIRYDVERGVMIE